ncbi:MAG: hypothetical protein MZW92_59350 [Comamonadaceae bacterium]|nr:hypothetical protein [Comamonadaceae bacterium]
MRVDGRPAVLGQRVAPDARIEIDPRGAQRAGAARHRAAAQADRLRQRPGRGRLRAGRRCWSRRPTRWAQDDQRAVRFAPRPPARPGAGRAGWTSTPPACWC